MWRGALEPATNEMNIPAPLMPCGPMVPALVWDIRFIFLIFTATPIHPTWETGRQSSLTVVLQKTLYMLHLYPLVSINYQTASTHWQIPHLTPLKTCCVYSQSPGVCLRSDDQWKVADIPHKLLDVLHQEQSTNLPA